MHCLHKAVKLSENVLFAVSPLIQSHLKVSSSYYLAREKGNCWVSKELQT